MDGNPQEVRIRDNPAQSDQNKQKKIWLLTYCPASNFITPQMLMENKIIVDECHSTCDRVMNYTYIHLPKKCRLSQLEKFFEISQVKYRIMKKEVYGYDAIGAQSLEPNAPKMQDHIAFQILLKHIQEDNPSFSPWTDGETALKRGHLFKAFQMVDETISTSALELQTKTQVIRYARILEERLHVAQRHFELFLEADQERSSLRMENAILKRKIAELDTQT